MPCSWFHLIDLRVQGMVMDLDQNRFETFEELYLYCYRVAGTVGLMTMPIMGTAADSNFEEALEPALALGVALQVCPHVHMIM